MALFFAFVREAKFQVTVSDFGAAFHKAHCQAANRIAKAVNQRIGKLNNQPQQANT
ncbi:Uncharacterised protein [Raoultella planticola]|uniref:Uncharacterized protein n=1 Tax=Raoultella planticola TaxID=575 RepID=A0A485CIM7_RAOPL|nr:Uncharacterised protein [Raoultella planticola]